MNRKDMIYEFEKYLAQLANGVFVAIDYIQDGEIEKALDLLKKMREDME